MNSIKTAWNTPISTASLVYFRLAFGLLFLFEGIRYYARGTFGRYWIEPEMHFGYELFEWLPHLNPEMTTFLYGSMGIFLLMMVLGLFYRVSSVLFFILNAYFFLLDKTSFMNHYYMFVLMSFIAMFLPANKLFSLDTFFKRTERSHYSPGWSLWLIRFQLSIVYLFGGIAKINQDWLRAEPMSLWLKRKDDLAIIGPYVEEDWMGYAFAYGGMFLDLAVVPMLLFKKTRWWAMGALTAFHLMNRELFNIGIFPWVMLGLSLLYFPSKNFQKIGARISSSFSLPKKKVSLPSYKMSSLGMALMAAFIAYNVLMPLRHHLYKGDASWTEEGHFFSWRMMLRDKKTKANIRVYDNKTNQVLENIKLRDYVTKGQKTVLMRKPDMFLQLAHKLRDKFNDEGKYTDFSIKAQVMSGLNGREKQLLIHPNVDLATTKFSYGTNDWILPLETPLHGAAPEHLLPQAFAKIDINELLKTSKVVSRKATNSIQNSRHKVNQNAQVQGQKSFTPRATVKRSKKK